MFVVSAEICNVKQTQGIIHENIINQREICK